jgi:hypothetical protein
LIARPFPAPLAGCPWGTARRADQIRRGG